MKLTSLEVTRTGWLRIPLYFLLAIWALVGFVLMGVLANCDCAPIPTDSMVTILPVVASVMDASVFDRNIAFQHFATMCALSPLLILAAWIFPTTTAEKKALIKKPEMAKIGVAVLFCLAVVSLYLDFYTGRLTLGLGRTALGFAFLSAIESSFFAIAIRYLKLSFYYGDLK